MSAPSASFAHVPDGPKPQNTGAASIDLNVDRVIGRDADRQWSVIAQRQNHKIKVLNRNPEKSGHDLSRTYDDDYRVMKPDERKAAETARSLHHTAVSEIKKHVQGATYLAKRLGGPR